jgi:Dolichyl-phosphate-mannose-protein mannosyltransferase
VQEEPIFKISGLPNSVMRRWLITTAISVGVVFRLLAYFRNRSLWFDEAALAINIIERPLSALFRSLEFHQGAPVGFLAVEKIVTFILGPGELALRLFPLICGLLTVLLVADVARLYVSPGAVPLAIALVAVNPALIYYSSDVKQYSSDALVTLLLLWAFVRLAESELRGRKMVAFGLIGAVAVWLSHPAVFWVASAAIVFILSARTDKSRIAKLTLISASWAMSSAALYVLSLHQLANDGALLNFWAQYFPPRPMGSVHTLLWFFDVFSISFRDPAGIAIIPGIGFFVVGCAALFRRNHILGWIIFGSCLAVVLAASIRRYPLGGRLLIFAVPVMLMLVAEGVATVCVRFRHAKFALVAVGCFVLAQPVLSAVRDVRSLAGTQPDDIRPIIEYVEAHARPSDLWYVYSQAQPQMRYYSDVLGLHVDWKLGSDCEPNGACYTSDIDSLVGSARAWIIMSHVLVRDKTDDRKILVEQLDRKGRRLEEFSTHSAQVYLYDFSGPERAEP